MKGRAQIRVVPVDDTSASHAVGLLRRFFREEGFRGDAATIEKNLGRLNADPFHWSAVAMTTDDQAVGIVTVTTMLFVEWGRLGEIGDLYVLPAHRGRGVARQLVRASTDWCRGLGCSAVSVTITPDGQAAHNLSYVYAALGFSATGRTISTLGIC